MHIALSVLILFRTQPKRYFHAFTILFRTQPKRNVIVHCPTQEGYMYKVTVIYWEENFIEKYVSRGPKYLPILDFCANDYIITWPEKGLMITVLYRREVGKCPGARSQRAPTEIFWALKKNLLPEHILYFVANSRFFTIFAPLIFNNIVVFLLKVFFLVVYFYFCFVHRFCFFFAAMCLIFEAKFQIRWKSGREGVFFGPQKWLRNLWTAPQPSFCFQWALPSRDSK